MSILFHIFVVLIAFTMPTKENINVPEATAITSIHGVSDKPFAEGTSYFTTMKMIKDLGMLYVTPKSKQKRHQAIYECPYCKSSFKTVRDYVKNGTTVSCGCYRRDKHGLSSSRLYSIWTGIKERCYNPNNVRYDHYGKRGIVLCPEWRYDFKAFHEWAIANGYKNELQIDRENNDKNYSPDNCRWTTAFVNNQNTRLTQKNNTTGYRCVFFNKRRPLSPWRVQLGYNGKYYKIGHFTTIELAVNAYNNFVIQNKTNHPLNKI